MSKTAQFYTCCQKCEKNFDVKQYISVNSEVENAVEKIRSGEFMIHKCPHCGHMNFVERSFLYNDLEGSFMVQYAVDKDTIYEYIHAFEDIEDKFPNILHRQQNRLITGNYHKFVEKIVIFKSNLNDKIIELYKYYLRSAIDRKGYLDIMFEASKDFTQYRFNVI